MGQLTGTEAKTIRMYLATQFPWLADRDSIDEDEGVNGADTVDGRGSGRYDRVFFNDRDPGDD